MRAFLFLMIAVCFGVMACNKNSVVAVLPEKPINITTNHSSPGLIGKMGMRAYLVDLTRALLRILQMLQN